MGADLMPTARAASVVLNPKREHFAQLYASHGNASRAYREAFDVSAGTKPGTVWQRAYELVHEPTVAERVRQLLAQAAEGTTISARARMLRLQDIIEADPGEVFRIVTEPCAFCWRDPLALAAALDQAIAAGSDLPDSTAPQGDCAQCRGHGVQRVLVTDTDKLSASARKLLRSVRQKASGEIEVRLHDQLAAADLLNRMQGSYIERSVTLNAHVAVKPLPAGLSVEDALRMLETIVPAPADDPTVVSDQ
jgi:terminase small subunit-like protein